MTHLLDKPLPPLVGTPFDDLRHMLLTDYLLHWVDVTRTWLETAPGGHGEVVSVRAYDSRVPGQPAAAKNPWSATVDLTTAGGATATIRIVGDVVASEPSSPFWVHGTTGTLRGSVLLDSDRLSLDHGDGAVDLPLPGAWFVDGFAATMGELMCAVAEDRQPENSAADAARSVALVLAAADSADAGGAPVQVPRRQARDVTFVPLDEVPVGPDARVYAEGWQSWSPATWYAPGARGLRPDLGWQHTCASARARRCPRRACRARGCSWSTRATAVPCAGTPPAAAPTSPRCGPCSTATCWR